MSSEPTTIAPIPGYEPSERAKELLGWIGDVIADPARQAWTLSGTILCSQAVREGAVDSDSEFTMLFVQLLAAGEVHCDIARTDQ